MSQFVTGVRAHATAFARKPLNIVLLVVLPPIATVAYAEELTGISPLASSLEHGVELGALARLTGALWATGFLVGIIGLFQVISARRGDERLVLCGFSRRTLLATRLVVVIGAAVVAAGVSFVAIWAAVPVDVPLAAFGALFIAGVMYGLLGMVVGALLPRELEGSLVLAFLVDIDDALVSGLFIPTTTVLPKFFPLYHPHALLRAAVFDGTIATDHTLGASVYLLVLAALAFVVYSRVTDGRGVGA